MNSRKILTVAMLFVLAAIAIIILNRIPFFTESDTTTPIALIEEQPQAMKKAEFFDSKRGVKTGEMTAKSFTILDDGAIEAEEVQVDLWETEVGDVRFTAEAARMTMQRVEDGYAGKFEMTGGVEFRSQSEQQDFSGSFERMTYDSAANAITATGPFEITSGEGITVSGTDLSGNIRKDEMQFTAKRHVRVRLEPEALPGGAGDSGPLVIEAGGPMVFDGPGRKVRFGGDVSVTMGQLRLEGSMLTLDFEAGDDALPGEWELGRMEMAGPVEARREDFTVVGDRLYWDAAGGVAGVEGEPALFASGEGFIESPAIEIGIGEGGAVDAIDGRGPGSAYFAGGRREERPDEAAGKSVAASWGEGISFDGVRGFIDIKGAVTIEGGDYTGAADRVTARITPAETQADAEAAAAPGDEDRSGWDADWFDTLAERITGFDAFGNVAFSDEKVSVSGDYASYNAAADTVTLSGAPARATTEGADIVARSIAFERLEGRLVAQGGCRIEIASVEVAEAGDQRVVATADRVEAEFDEDVLGARCSGSVNVEWGESMLSCESLEIAGVSIAEGGEPAESASVKGEGGVVFRRGELSARCGAFSLDRALAVLELFPAEGGEVEIGFSDTATIWSDAVTINEAQQRAVCARPRALLQVRGSLMGFQEPVAAESREVREMSRIDLSAGDALVVTQQDEETATLEFTGGVEVARWDPRSPIEDRLACESLTLVVAVEPADAADGSEKDTRIVAANAAGDVYLRYWGPDGTLEARGESFEWEAESDIGRLYGSPAVAWLSGAEASATQRSREFLYNFTDRSVELIGGAEGTLVLPRPLAR